MRIAILGGTFDPVHNGHLAAAQSVAATFATDQVHFVPAYSAPHKQSREASSPFHRFAMVALAISPFADFRASTVEMDALEKRYTIDTLRLLREALPQDELVFVLGTDMYQEFETWKDYTRLFDLTNLAIINRPGFPFRQDLAPFRVVREGDIVSDLPSKPAVFYLPFVEQPISSTEIRKGCRDGLSVSAWLPPEVWSYIERNRIYS